MQIGTFYVRIMMTRNAIQITAFSKFRLPEEGNIEENSTCKRSTELSTEARTSGIVFMVTNSIASMKEC